MSCFTYIMCFKCGLPLKCLSSTESLMIVLKSSFLSKHFSSSRLDLSSKFYLLWSSLDMVPYFTTHEIFIILRQPHISKTSNLLFSKSGWSKLYVHIVPHLYICFGEVLLTISLILFGELLNQRTQYDIMLTKLGDRGLLFVNTILKRNSENEESKVQYSVYLWLLLKKRNLYNSWTRIWYIVIRSSRLIIIVVTVITINSTFILV